MDSMKIAKSKSEGSLILQDNSSEPIIQPASTSQTTKAQNQLHIELLQEGIKFLRGKNEILLKKVRPLLLEI